MVVYDTNEKDSKSQSQMQRIRGRSMTIMHPMDCLKSGVRCTSLPHYEECPDFLLTLQHESY